MTQPLLLIVRGGKMSALAHAREHGVPVTVLRQDQGDTICRTDARHRDAVASWFAEPDSALMMWA
jgi:hypothetical protein